MPRGRYYGVLSKIRKQLSREEHHASHLAMRKVIPSLKPRLITLSALLITLSALLITMSALLITLSR